MAVDTTAAWFTCTCMGVPNGTCAMVAYFCTDCLQVPIGTVCLLRNILQIGKHTHLILTSSEIAEKIEHDNNFFVNNNQHGNA